MRVVSVVPLVAIAATGVVMACGSDEGGGQPGCEGPTCDGGSVETSTPDGSQPQADGGNPSRDGGNDAGSDGDAAADAGPSENCGDGAAPGMLDENFGQGGLVWLKYPGSGANAVAIQQDGKIVIGGYLGGAGGGAAVIRLMPDGSLDPSFGTNGLVVSYQQENYTTNALALQPDGRILVSGTTNGATKPTFVTRRHLTSGSLDPSFGDNGVVVASFGTTRAAYPAALSLQADGKILVSGFSETAAAGSADYEVLRYNPNGSLDIGFGSGGRATIDIAGTRDVPGTIALTGGGKILVAGRSSQTLDDPIHTNLSIVQLDSAGAPDPTFASAGKFATSLGGREGAASALVDGTGRIVLGGQSGAAPDFGLFRLTTAGSLDPAFGGGGSISKDFGGTNDGVASVLQQPDGRLLAIGLSGSTAGTFRIVTSRYLTTGVLDPTFGNGGEMFTPPPPNADLRASAAALSSCGFVTVGTWSYDVNTSTKTAIGVARYRR